MCINQNIGFIYQCVGVCLFCEERSGVITAGGGEGLSLALSVPSDSPERGANSLSSLSLLCDVLAAADRPTSLTDCEPSGLGPGN